MQRDDRYGAGSRSPFKYGGGTGTIGISANGANCSWSASSNAPWAVLAPTNGGGNATLGVTISSNAASTTGRTAGLTVAGQTINVSQAGDNVHVRAWIGYGLGASGRRIGFGARDSTGRVHVVRHERRAVARDHGVGHWWFV